MDKGSMKRHEFHRWSCWVNNKDYCCLPLVVAAITLKQQLLQLSSHVAGIIITIIRLSGEGGGGRLSQGGSWVFGDVHGEDTLRRSEIQQPKRGTGLGRSTLLTRQHWLMTELRCPWRERKVQLTFFTHHHLLLSSPSWCSVLIIIMLPKQTAILLSQYQAVIKVVFVIAAHIYNPPVLHAYNNGQLVKAPSSYDYDQMIKDTRNYIM